MTARRSGSAKELSSGESRPRATGQDAARLVRDYWGKRVLYAPKEHPSESDRIFEILAEAGECFFLKISASDRGEDELEAESRVLSAARTGQSCYRVPRPVADARGAPWRRVALGGRPHLLRLFEAAPGVPLEGYRPITPEARRQIGMLAARMQDALIGAPGERKPGLWDLGGAFDFVRERLDEAPVPGERKQLLLDVLRDVDNLSGGRANTLERGATHHDLNPGNILVDPTRLVRGAPKFVGVVDFGDARRASRISELAIACAYAGLGLEDPVQGFADVAEGYATIRGTSSEEADMAYALARLRLAQSVVISSLRADAGRENPYLLASQEPAWAALEKTARVHPRLARYRLRHALGHAPVPKSANVERALRRAGRNAPSILGGELADGPFHVVDISVERGLGGADAEVDPAVAAKRVFAYLEDLGGGAGVGRYDEARWCYLSRRFRAPGNEGAQWRTVHLGIDLFAPENTPLHTPLPGRVVSLENHDDRLDYGPTIILEHVIPSDEGPLKIWTLLGHLAAPSLELLRDGEEVEAGQLLGWIGGFHENGGWAPHVHYQVIVDRLGRKGNFPGVAAPAQRDPWCSISPDPGPLLGLPSSSRAQRPRPAAAMIEERTRRLAPSLSLSYDKPLHIVRGRGARLYDEGGQPFLDCVNNIAHVGHSHPRVSAALCAQMDILNTNTRYLHGNVLEYAERLLATFPEPLEVCIFVCSGTEANELALRMARTHTGKVGAVVLDGAYHGNSSSVLNLSPYKFDGPGGKGRRPWVRVAPMPDLYRGVHAGEEEAASLYAAHVGAAARALETEASWFEGRPPGAAAFFHESILSCGGQIPLPPGYLAEAYALVRAQGAVCVADEVQTGFARSGEHFWAFEEHGVVPDIATLGKPMGNGHPLSAVVTTREIARSFANGMEYFNSFGGSPVGAAVGSAVLDVIEEERLAENARRVGAMLLEGLGRLARESPVIGDARGRGLFLGMEFTHPGSRRPDPLLASWCVERARARGTLLSADGPDRNVIKIKPPMVFSMEDAEELLGTLEAVLEEDAFQPGGRPSRISGSG